MTGASNVGTTAGKRRTLRTDGSIVVSVLIETATVNVAETVMETESGTENTASANEILNGTETDAIGIAIGTETAIVTVNEVTDTDGTKRIVIERAGRTATSVVGLLSPPRIGVNLLDRVIVLLLLPRKHWASEEDPPTMTYVQSSSLMGFIGLYSSRLLRAFDWQSDRAPKRSSREKGGREDRSRRSSDKEKDHERTRDSDRRRRDREEDASDGRQAPPEKVRNLVLLPHLRVLYAIKKESLTKKS
jgi:hypothetical protein